MITQVTSVLCGKAFEMELTFARIGSHETVKFAFEELRRYLHLIDCTVNVHLKICDTYDQSATGVIWLGCDEAFCERLPKVKDSRYDDSVYIDIENNEGIITGTNARSILIAVYRLLRELGCVWHRPGEEGEKIPEKRLDALNIRICETPSKRHRCIDMLGATSEEAHEALVDWLPKVGMNSVFIEFETPHENYKAWYEHENNPTLPSKPHSFSDTVCYYKALKEQIHKRSILLHSFGHGWTLYSLGVLSEDAFIETDDMPDTRREKLALINGERHYFQRKPMFSALCYSREDIRRDMTDAYVECVKNNPNVDFIHFWLSDGCNNHCECPECKDTRPSDYYVTMLNEIDRRLTEEKIDTKVVFIIYVDLLWAPEKTALINPDRFIMMFAPITRLFNEPYGTPHPEETLRPYERNRLVWPLSPHENLLYLNEWRKTFSGETFVFDYHLIWNHFKDMGYSHISKILAQDIEAYDECSLEGLLSAQVTRAHFPTNLPMYTMARKLWNKDEDFEKISREYYREAFGIDWAHAKKYCEKISDAFRALYSFDSGKRNPEEEMVLLSKVRCATEELSRQNVRAGGFDEEVHWYALNIHMELVEAIAEMLDYLYRGFYEFAEEKKNEAFRIAQEAEKTLSRSFDTKTFVFIWQIIFDSIKQGNAIMVQD